MYTYLDKINSPRDIKNYTKDQIEIVAKEIRTFLIDSVSKTGGHLSSNLGVVELTLALHRVFDSPKDKLIWDVGHQAYVHKILTGRKKKFPTLRKYKGLSGFPKECESEHDILDTGHSSTSISAGLGIACARDIKGEEFDIVTVIGDGSITGGLAFEGLNNLGYLKKKMIVILNDNEMSIDKNIGAFSEYFSSEESINGELIRGLGIEYIGPVDGHNIEELENALKEAKKIEGPVFIHVKTVKGKGYKFAEENPCKYHGVNVFEPKNGINTSSKRSNSEIAVNKLIEIAKCKKDVVAITAAMPSGTKLKMFEDEFPNRYFDVGIAEQHAVTFSVGLAKQGLKPYFVVYSTFLQRSFDQLIHDVAITKKNVKFLVDRAGIVGHDGETHHGIFDLSYLNLIPDMMILSPADATELEMMIDYSTDIDGPMAIRYARGKEKRLFGEQSEEKSYKKIEIGKPTKVVTNKNSKVAVIGVGQMVETAINVAKKLSKIGIEIDVYNARFIKPLDYKSYKEIFSEYSKVVTIEDNTIVGGFGSNIITLLNKFKNENAKCDVKIYTIGIEDKFVSHGCTEALYKSLKLDEDSIVKRLSLLCPCR